MIYRILTLIFLTVTSISVSATTWTTTKPGYWNNPSIWSSGMVPPTSSSDTFLIKHCVNILDNLEFKTGSRLIIENQGGLCGHQKMVVHTTVRVDKYGVLELDSLVIISGKVYCHAPGDVVLTTSAELSGTGAYLEIDGCGFAVGPWFECGRPGYQFTVGVEDVLTAEMEIYPNPLANYSLLHIKNTGNLPLEIVLIDRIGRNVFNGSFVNNSIALPRMDLLTGVYCVQLYSNGIYLGTKLLVVD